MSARKPAGTELRPTNRRLENFSDGVFAIVITIMVIDVRIPASLAFSDDPPALMQFSTALGAYALSFIVIANLWTSHHYLIFTVNRPTRSTIWFNNLLLFWTTMLPLTTRFLGHFPRSPRAAAAFGIVAFCATAAFMLLRSHARRTSLMSCIARSTAGCSAERGSSSASMPPQSRSRSFNRGSHGSASRPWRQCCSCP